MRKNGLIDGHTYSITKVIQFRDIAGLEHWLLRIRNPWGNSKEWNGTWSDNSQEMRNLSLFQKEAYGIVKEEDGEFFITWNEFLEVPPAQ